MSVYKFRVAYEEDENIFRDIEIQPAQTLYELNDIIKSGFNLPDKSERRLFRSNDNWHKLNELDMSPKAVKKGKNVMMPMLISYIDDPHQRFLYEFETAKQSFSLLIELLNISSVEKAGESYPKVVKSAGPSPVKKEDLMAHLSRKVEVVDEELGVDAEDDALEGMGEEGEEGGAEETADDADDFNAGDFSLDEGAEDFKLE